MNRVSELQALTGRRLNLKSLQMVRVLLPPRQSPSGHTASYLARLTSGPFGAQEGAIFAKSPAQTWAPEHLSGATLETIRQKYDDKFVPSTAEKCNHTFLVHCAVEWAASLRCCSRGGATLAHTSGTLSAKSRVINFRTRLRTNVTLFLTRNAHFLPATCCSLKSSTA